MTRLDPTRPLAVADVVVIGGGLHGCSAALHCAMRGLSVVVLEKNTVARHASGVNAGGVRRLGRDFAEVPISVASMEIWRRIEELVDDDCGFQSCPQVMVAVTETEMESLGKRARSLRDLGFDHEELVERDRLRDLLPAISGDCAGGLASIADGYANPYRTTFAFQRKAVALGVKFFERTRALDVVRNRDDWRVETPQGIVVARTLVNCAGAWAGLLAARLGEPAPMEAIAPMMIVTSRLPHFCDAVVVSRERPLSFKQMPNGTVVIGGGRRGVPDIVEERTELRFDELAKTARTAAEFFPIVRQSHVIRAWAGIEGRMPDDIPVIGPSSTEPNAVHAFGFSAHGFQLGPAVGGIIAELIATGHTNMPIDPFRITRFTA